MLYLAQTPSHSRMLAKRVERGSLVRLARAIYSDDKETPAEDQIRAAAIPIAAHFYRNAYISHASAAIRGPINGILFISQPGGKKNALTIPGLRIVRFPAIAHPETERIKIPIEIVTTKDDMPATATAIVSTALQTVFECLASSRHYPERQLSDGALIELISTLSKNDIMRAPAFAERNKMERDYSRFQKLISDTAAQTSVHTTGIKQFELYFYNWHVGSLTALSNSEFRYRYAKDWPIELSRELPLSSTSNISYESSRMPAFFENFLPEGWTENRIVRTYQIDSRDTVALLASTRKYLSNLTLRPLDIPEKDFRLDTHTFRLDAVAKNPTAIIRATEMIEHDPETAQFWKELRNRGAVGLSGIQPKLPVSLTVENKNPTVRIGDLRTPCTHILKFQSPHYKFLVENEWATMELARRVGLRVASTRLIAFETPRPFQGISLIVERYDIPVRSQLENNTLKVDLMLQEDTCSLLLLSRNDKYKTSIERIADALRTAGLSDDLSANGLWRLVEHATFSWLIGNGDLHAKNISTARLIRSSALGNPPKQRAIEYAPLYDLLNTRLAIPDDDFAIPVNGKRNNLRPRDIASVAERWKGSKKVSEQLIAEVASKTRVHLQDVLSSESLPTELSERYYAIAHKRLQSFGV